MPANRYNRGHWRNTFPMLALWCEDQDNATSEHGQNYAAYGYLSEYATNLLAGHLDRERAFHTDEPARAWDALYVPNGDYQVQVTEGRRRQQRFDFRIHLVQDGTLRGQRIIKIRREGETTFRGFAFVTRTGGFRLWTRYASDANEPYVNAANLLVRALGQMEMPLEAADSPLVWSDDRTTTTVRVAFALRCASCNNLAQNFDTAGMAFCNQHRTVVPEEPTGTPPFEVVGEMIYDDNIRMPVVDLSHLPRCELGTGEIQ